MNILKIIEDRKNYPLMKTKNSEMDYVFNKLSQKKEQVGLVLPIGFFQHSKDRDLRKLIFDEWHILANFDLGSIWEPWTSIKFNLLILQKNPPDEVFFTQYLSDKTYTVKDKNYSKNGEIGAQVILKEYEEYIQALQKIIDGETIEKNDNINFWKIPSSEINLDNLSSNFYDPRLVENEKKLQKLQQEKTDILENLVDIIKPRKLKDPKEGFVLKTKDFKYPLVINKLSKEKATTVELKQNDIVFSNSFSGNKKFFLIHKDYKSKIYASSFLNVIRLKSSKITAQYLFLYLQSEVIQKYFEKYTIGGVIKQINLKNLKSLPVIIPEKSTLEKSNHIFEKRFLVKKESILDEINKELFDKVNLPSTPIQKEFIFEKLEDLRIWKKEIIKNILENDFRELEIAKKQKLYKSFVILAGAILEAFLMDWLSEEDKYDYFSSEEELILAKLIRKLFSLREGKIPDDRLYKMANYIRDTRNLIHPKKFFNSQIDLDETICNRILKDLRIIIKKRK